MQYIQEKQSIEIDLDDSKQKHETTTTNTFEFSRRHAVSHKNSKGHISRFKISTPLIHKLVRGVT